MDEAKAPRQIVRILAYYKKNFLGHQQRGINWKSVYGHPLLKGTLPLHRKTRRRMMTRPCQGNGGDKPLERVSRSVGHHKNMAES